jgi:hypothetical protein
MFVLLHGVAGFVHLSANVSRPTTQRRKLLTWPGNVVDGVLLFHKESTTLNYFDPTVIAAASAEGYEKPGTIGPFLCANDATLAGIVVNAESCGCPSAAG